jgi:hypothetical protein
MEEIVDDSESIKSSLSHDSCQETIDINNSINSNNNNNITMNKKNMYNINYKSNINNNQYSNPYISDVYANHPQQLILQNISYHSLFNTYHSTISRQETNPIIIGTDESIDNISMLSKNQINENLNNNMNKNLNIKKRKLISVPMTLSSMETEPAIKYMKYLLYKTSL